MPKDNAPARTSYKRVGTCQRCGRCCRGRPLFDSIVNGDSGYSKELVAAIQVFACDIDKMNCPDCTVDKSGFATCLKYKDRPEFCKLYPAEPSDLIPGCGFSFIKEES